MEEPKMFKKFLTLLMSLTLILSLAACGGSTTTVKVTNEAAQEAAQEDRQDEWHLER